MTTYADTCPLCASDSVREADEYEKVFGGCRECRRCSALWNANGVLRFGRDTGVWQPELPNLPPLPAPEQQLDLPGVAEADPTGRDPHQPGAKLDAGKAPMLRGLLDYFPRATLAVANVSAFGASKYAWKGWESVPNGAERYSDALGRHIVKEAIEGPIDRESGLRHAAHAAWCALARLELLQRADEQAASWAGETR